MPDKQHLSLCVCAMSQWWIMLTVSSMGSSISERWNLAPAGQGLPPFLFCFYCDFISLLLCLTLSYSLPLSPCLSVSLFLCLSVRERGATFMRCLWRSEDGIGYPGTGIISSCRPSDKGTGNQTGVLCMSSECSLQLSYLSRPKGWCWLMWEDLAWLGVMGWSLFPGWGSWTI